MKRLLFLISIFSFVLSSNAQMHKVEFVENKGQWETPIKYKAKIPAGNIYLHQNEITYQFYSEEDIERLHDLHHQKIATPTKSDFLLNLHAFKLSFVGANTESIISDKPTKDYVNYYVGNDKSKWASNVKKYGEVKYKNLYAGIDLKYYLKGHHLKYDFIVAPFSEPNNIQIKYEGQDELFIKDGKLIIQTTVNSIEEQEPYVYQLINGKKKEVKCEYKLENNTLSFEFPKGYDKSKELIIDPTLVFASYSGSTADNWGYTSTYDDAGNLYGGGVTFGVGYPSTVGAYQLNFAGGNGNYGAGCDISITKFSSDGSTAIYATYLGGAENESPHSLIVNSNNELLIFGTTSSADYPTTIGAYDNSYNGGTTYTGVIPNYMNGSDIIISKLNTAGTNLLASTFIGGSDNDGLNIAAGLNYNYADDFRGEIVIDGADNVYVASSTLSNDFPVTGGAFQNSLSGNQDGCVFKLSSNLNTLLWSSYIGGSLDDAAYSLQFSTTGDVLITGGTESVNFPTTPGGLLNANQGMADGWVSKINNTATNILASTYLGTADYDQSYFVQLDSANNVYVVGQTEGNYPISSTNVYSNPNSGQFLHKLDPNLGSTVFSTSFGTSSGEIDIALSAFLVNECNYIFISGWGGTVNSFNGGPAFSTTNGLPITPGAVQSSTDGSDYYLMLLSENADTLLYSTFFGGNSSNDHVDGGTSRFDKKGIVYQAVCSSCGSATSDFPTTAGSWSTTDNSPNCNLGVFKIDLTSLDADAELYAGPEYCLGDSVKFQNLSTGGISFVWDFGDGNTSNAYEPTHYYSQPGIYNVALIILDNVTCLINDTDYVQVTIKDPQIQIRPDTAVCIGDEITLWASGGENHLWSPSSYVNNPSSDTTTVIVMEQTTYNLYVESDGCILDLSVNVDTLVRPTVNLGDDIKADWGTVVQLLSNSNATNYWYTPINGLSCSTCPNPKVTSKESVTYYLTVQGANGCYNYDTINIIYDGAIYLPNSFTPDGDGINDIFYAFGKDIIEFEMYIFNRWGQKMFYTNDMSIGWDGTFEGNLVQTESYVWKVRFKDTVGKSGEMYGTVTLLK